MEAKTLLEVKNVTAGYPGHVALKDVNFSVAFREAVAVVGPNGGGKSTLLKVIMGLLEPKEGTVLFCNKSLMKNREMRTKIAYLPQQSAINPHFPALIEDIVRLGLYGELGLLKSVTKEHEQRIIEALEKVDMARMIGEPFEHLSGGQKQRVLIARALISNPVLLLLDEPTTGLDLKSQESILQTVKDLSEKEKLTVIAVTHDQVFLKNWAERVIRIEQRLTFDGSSSEYFQRSED